MKRLRGLAVLLLVLSASGIAWRLRPTSPAPAPAARPAERPETPPRPARVQSVAPRPVVPPPGTVFVTGRLTEAGFPIARQHLIYCGVRLREAGEPRRPSRPAWSFPDDGGTFAIEAPAGPRDAELFVAAGYVVVPDDPELGGLSAERVLAVRIGDGPVTELGDVPMPEHPQLGSVEGEAAGVELAYIHLEGRTESGRLIRPAAHLGLSGSPNAPMLHAKGSRFGAAWLPAGSYELWFVAEGCETLRTPLRLAPGEAKKGLQVSLRPSRFEVKGVALDAATGAPLGGVELRLDEAEPDPGLSVRVYASEGRSNADGSFAVKVAGLPACGLLRLTALREGYEGAAFEIPVPELAGAALRTLRLSAAR